MVLKVRSSLDEVHSQSLEAKAGLYRGISAVCSTSFTRIKLHSCHHTTYHPQKDYQYKRGRRPQNRLFTVVDSVPTGDKFLRGHFPRLALLLSLPRSLQLDQEYHIHKEGSLLVVVL